jgi:hypothetical protein
MWNVLFWKYYSCIFFFYESKLIFFLLLEWDINAYLAAQKEKDNKVFSWKDLSAVLDLNEKCMHFSLQWLNHQIYFTILVGEWFIKCILPEWEIHWFQDYINIFLWHRYKWSVGTMIEERLFEFQTFSKHEMRCNATSDIHQLSSNSDVCTIYCRLKVFFTKFWRS